MSLIVFLHAYSIQLKTNITDLTYRLVRIEWKERKTKRYYFTMQYREFLVEGEMMIVFCLVIIQGRFVS